MSFFVTRPPRPLPSIWPTSMPCSEAMRATTGETNERSWPPPSPSASGGAAGAGVSAAGSGLGGGGASSTFAAVAVSPSAPLASADSSAACCVAGSGGSSTGSPPPSGEMTASFVPTSTVSPSGTRICVRTPLAGLGTSVSTLSVEISRSDSSAAISSPSAFSHFVIVPSETETPICGMTTSTAVCVATGPS